MINPVIVIIVRLTDLEIVSDKRPLEDTYGYLRPIKPHISFSLTKLCPHHFHWKRFGKGSLYSHNKKKLSSCSDGHLSIVVTQDYVLYLSPTT